MVPIDKVKDIINKHISLEKELSAGNVDPKLFAKKSKEYSNLGNIINTCLLYTSPSPRDLSTSRMPSSA